MTPIQDLTIQPTIATTLSLTFPSCLQVQCSIASASVTDIKLLTFASGKELKINKTSHKQPQSNAIHFSSTQKRLIESSNIQRQPIQDEVLHDALSQLHTNA